MSKRKSSLERFISRWSFPGTKPGDKFEADLMRLLDTAYNQGVGSTHDQESPYIRRK